jgi:hypothetical protein
VPGCFAGTAIGVRRQAWTTEFHIFQTFNVDGRSGGPKGYTSLREVKAPTSPRPAILIFDRAAFNAQETAENAYVGPKAVKSTKTYGASLETRGLQPTVFPEGHGRVLDQPRPPDFAIGKSMKLAPDEQTDVCSATEEEHDVCVRPARVF